MKGNVYYAITYDGFDQFNRLAMIFLGLEKDYNYKSIKNTFFVFVYIHV